METTVKSILVKAYNSVSIVKCHVSIHCLAENPATQVFNQMFNTVNNIIACNCTQ